jgi:hypothetical protein
MANPILTSEEVRLFLQDREELNTLLLGIRFTPEMIEQAMINTVDYYNLMNPPTGVMYSLEQFPYRSLLLLGTAAYLLRSGAINEAANQLTYAADGIQVNDKDKAQVFMSLAMSMQQEFKELGQQIKMNQNISQIYGVKHSEYVYRRRY